MEQIDTQKLKVTYHEIGHLVAYWLYFGNIDDIVRVRIFPTEDKANHYSGEVTWGNKNVRKYDYETEEGKRYAFGLAVLSAGGPVMAYIYAESLGQTPSVGSTGDITNFTFRMEQYFGITDDSIINDLLAKARDWVRPKFWEYRQLVKALAHELYQKGELTKGEMSEILNNPL